MPRCSGVKQNVTVTSKSASASIWRSNQAQRVGPKTVGPGEPSAQMDDAEPLHPGDRLLEAVILEMEPLAEAHLRRELGEALERRLGRSVLAQQAHAK